MIMNIQVAILDDEEWVREGIKHKYNFAKNSFSIIYEGDDGVDLLEKIKLKLILPDICLVDMMMPKISGIDFIQKAKELLPATHFIVISGFDDFSLVKKSLKLGVSDYLLKPIDPAELYQVLNSEKEKMKMTFQRENEKFHDELAYHFCNKEMIHYLSESSKQKLFDLVHQFSCFHLILMGNIYSSAPLNVYQEIINSKLSEEGEILYPYGVPPYWICFEEPKKMQLIIEQLHFPTATVVTVKNIEDMNDLPTLYKKASSIIPSLLTLSKKKMISIDANYFDDEIRHEFFHIENNYEKTIKLIASEGEQTALNALYYLLNQPIPQNKKEQAFQLFVWKYYKSEVLMEWLQSFDTTILFTEHCKQFINILKEKRQPLTGRDIINRIIKDLQREYGSKKTLKDYAECYHIHPNYLARLFKQTLGTTFMETLMNLRIDNAKQLLLNTPMKIGEIAQIVGYDDIRYFSQVFRKFTGFTPSQFKEENIRLESEAKQQT